MGASNSSNVQTRPDNPQTQHTPEDSTFVGIPSVVVEHFKSAFLSRQQELLNAILNYYKGHPKDKNKLLREISKYMVRVRFDPHDQDMSPLTLISLFGPVPAARLECQNTLSMGRIVASGTYGEVWMAHVNGHPVAVKISKGREHQSLLEEAMLLVLLTSSLSRDCFERHARMLVVDGLTTLPFPQVNFLVRNASVLKYKLMMGMQPLDLTIRDLVLSEPSCCTEDDFADVLAQLLQQLYMVQQVYGFQHKDMKFNNVMLRRRSTPVNVIRRIGHEGPSSMFISRFEVVFIDLGTSCVSMNACGIDLQLENYNSFYDQTRILCANHSYDLMLFFVSLIPHMPAFIARQRGGSMTEWWQEVIKPVMELATMHNIVDINASSFLDVYKESMLWHMKSDDVRPEKLFFRLVTALNKRERARMLEITAQRPNARIAASNRYREFLRLQRACERPPLSQQRWEVVVEDTDDDNSSSDDRDNKYTSPHSKQSSPVWDWEEYRNEPFS